MAQLRVVADIAGPGPNDYVVGCSSVMSLFEMTGEALSAVPVTDFAAEGIWERRDLQRVLRDNIEAIDDTLLVVAEEFGDVEGSDRRIDLLCVDR